MLGIVLLVACRPDPDPVSRDPVGSDTNVGSADDTVDTGVVEPFATAETAHTALPSASTSDTAIPPHTATPTSETAHTAHTANTALTGSTADTGDTDVLVDTGPCDDDRDFDGFTCDVDCDEFNEEVYPTAPEQCANGRDDDCDPSTSDEYGTGCTFDCIGVDPVIRFVDITADIGLPTDHGPEPPSGCGQGLLMGGGAAVSDIDGDGDVDLFLVEPTGDRLWRNDGGTFTDMGVLTNGGNAAQFVDVDGDGDLDLFVSTVREQSSELFINQGNFVFTEEAALRGADLMPFPGLCADGFSVSAADVDGDDDLDLFHTGWYQGGPPWHQLNQLLINDGTGHFSVAPVGVNLTGVAAFTPSFGDLDDDGDQDLALTADWMTSKLLQNTGVGLFVDVTTQAGVGTDRNGMGADLGDFDNDGDLDWYQTAIFLSTLPCSPSWGCSGNRLWRNDGGMSFTDVTQTHDVLDGGWGWGTAFADFDNDGWLDIVEANGYPVEGFWTQPVALRMNVNGLRFDRAECMAGLIDQRETRAVLPFDLEGDGDLDLLITAHDGHAKLWRNDGGDANSWLQIDLQGVGDNPYGIGAKVLVTAGAQVRRRDVNANSPFLAGRPATVHFGLGGHESTVSVSVTWPDGVVQTLSAVDPRQTLTVVHP